MKRRTFLQTISATSATSLIPPTLQSAPAFHINTALGTNDTIRLAAIGTGIIGFSNLSNITKVPGIELVAAADVYDGRLKRVQELYGNHIITTRDYQEILARQDIDAVIISTTDHWHAQMAIDAMRAGKHVHVEKPMVQQVEDGLRLIQVQQETGKVLQVGSKQFRPPIMKKAKELLKNGAIGKLMMVESQVSRNNGNGAWQYTIPNDASPKTIDWKRFLGNAPAIAFDADRFFRWRKYWDYGTGVSGDMFVHRLTGVHYLLDALGPNRIMASGALRYWNDGRETPDVLTGLLEYPETAQHDAFTLLLKANFADGSGGGFAYRFIGSEGVLEINGRKLTLKSSRRQEPSLDNLINGYNSVRTFAKEQRAAFEQDYKKYQKKTYTFDQFDFGKSFEFEAPSGFSSSLVHYEHFAEVIRNGGTIYEDASYGFRACAPTLIVNKSYQQQKGYRWDPVSMKIVA
jgi:predicted dehydrogenase